MVFREIIATSYEKHKEHENLASQQNGDSFNFEAGAAHSYHSGLN